MKRALCCALVLAMGTSACKKKDEEGEGETEAPAESAGTGEEPTATAEDDKPEEPAGDEALVKRGEYLAALAGCQQCHTPFGPNGPEMSKAFAGGLEVKEKFGTWRSPNITQDEKTGIGGWSDEEITKAIREGVRPDGSRLYPVMPYPFYHKLSDDDTKAIVAFLRTIEPIENEVEPSEELPLPKMELPPAEGAAAPEEGVARGEYLANLMHCAMCHSPPDDKGAPDFSKAFAGGFPFEIPELGEGVLYAANLTPHKEQGIGAWTDEQLVAAIKQMKKADGSVIVGPMALYQMGWYQMQDDDANALVAFLRSLPPSDNEVPASTFVAKGAEAPAKPAPK